MWSNSDLCLINLDEFLPMTTAPDVLAAIGNTPLITLRHASAVTGCTIFGKAEFMNPGGSVKDRPAWRMIQEGLRSGKLKPGKTILDSTSGNTGIALAMIGAVLGWRLFQSEVLRRRTQERVPIGNPTVHRLLGSISPT